jgi:hypothetical protein
MNFAPFRDPQKQSFCLHPSPLTFFKEGEGLGDYLHLPRLIRVIKKN